MELKEAFVLAGGKGERLLPLTQTIPKPMVKVLGKPILQYNIELLAGHGVTKIIHGTGYMHEKIEQYFGTGKKFGLEILYSREKEPLGTGGALKLCEEKLEGSFIMMNGDNIADFDFSAMHKKHKSLGAGASLQLASVEDVSGYGVARIEGEKIIEFVEKPDPKNAPSRLVNAGAYIIEKKSLEFVPSGFSFIERTMFPQLAKRGKLAGFRHKGYWFTTDTFERIAAAEKGLRALKNSK